LIALGDWEYVEADGGLFVGSGIYIYWKYKLDAKGEPARDATGNIILKPVSKLRGSNAKKYKMNENGDPWLVANVLPIWNAMRNLPQPGDKSGLVISEYKTIRHGRLGTLGETLAFSRTMVAGTGRADGLQTNPRRARAWRQTNAQYS
jgi:hypothetical protein